MPISLLRNGEGVIARGSVGEIPWLEEPVIVFRGEFLIVTGPWQVGSGDRFIDGRTPIEPHVPCTLPQVLPCVEKGHRIYFDDGKIEGVVAEADTEKLIVEITRADRDGAKLRSDRSINLPDTNLCLPALSEQDFEDLDFVAAHADMVGMSFVRGPQDLLMLQSELEKRGRSDAGIVLKIESRQAFDNLPKLLLTGLRRPGLGIMVARGDLAIEVGFERLAEVHEEIRWLCEAAHVPVIWGTQALESPPRKGHLSRAEISDAAMGVQTECVMLNQGPHVVEGVRYLVDILQRIQQRHQRDGGLLRSLSVDETVLQPLAANAND